jgi:hypothetical protein
MNYRWLDASGLKWVRRKYRETLEVISSSYAPRVRTAKGKRLLLEIPLILIASLSTGAGCRQDMPACSKDKLEWLRGFLTLAFGIRS